MLGAVDQAVGRRLRRWSSAASSCSAARGATSPGPSSAGWRPAPPSSCRSCSSAPSDFLAQVVAVQAARPADPSQTSAERLMQLFDVGPVGMGSVAAIGIVAAVVVLSMAALVAWRGGTFGAVLAALLAADDDDVPALVELLRPLPGLPGAGRGAGHRRREHAPRSSCSTAAHRGRSPSASAALVLVLLVGHRRRPGGPPGHRAARSSADYRRRDRRPRPARRLPDRRRPDVDPRGRAIPAAAGRRVAQIADLFGERVLRATAGGTVRFGRAERDAPQRREPGRPASATSRAARTSSSGRRRRTTGRDDRWAAFQASHRSSATGPPTGRPAALPGTGGAAPS